MQKYSRKNSCQFIKIIEAHVKWQATRKCFSLSLSFFLIEQQHQTHHHFEEAPAAYDQFEWPEWRESKKNSFHFTYTRRELFRKTIFFPSLRVTSMKSHKFSMKLVHDQYVANVYENGWLKSFFQGSQNILNIINYSFLWLEISLIS